MLVESGVDPADYDKTLAEIGRQVRALKDGDFTDDELTAAKRTVSSDTLALLDYPERLEPFYLGQDLLGLDYGPEELAALAEEVSREDIIKAAAGLACDGIYFLRGREDEDGED